MVQKVTKRIKVIDLTPDQSMTVIELDEKNFNILLKEYGSGGFIYYNDDFEGLFTSDTWYYWRKNNDC